MDKLFAILASLCEQHKFDILSVNLTFNNTETLSVIFKDGTQINLIQKELYEQQSKSVDL